MPIKKEEQITAWSYSRLSAYDICPFKSFLGAIKKIREPANKAMGRGKEIHKLAEDYTTGKLKKFPKVLFRFEEEFKALRKLKKILEVEAQLSVTKKWDPCDWFGRSTWLRSKSDCAYDLTPEKRKVIDYKSGQMKERNMFQLDMQVVVEFCHAPERIEEIEPEFWYTDAGVIVGRNYYDKALSPIVTRAEALKLRKELVKRSKKMLADTTFKPKPGKLCGYCYYSRDKHGDCKY